MYLVGQGWNCRKSYSTASKERDKETETVAFIGISSGNHGGHEYQQLSMEDRLADKVGRENTLTNESLPCCKRRHYVFSSINVFFVVKLHWMF